MSAVASRGATVTPSAWGSVRVETGGRTHLEAHVSAPGASCILIDTNDVDAFVSSYRTRHCCLSC